MKKLVLSAIGGALVGAGVGLFVGRMLALQHYEEIFEEALNREIAETKAHLNEVTKREMNRTINSEVGIETTTQDLDRIVTGLRYDLSKNTNSGVIKQNIFLDGINDGEDEDHTEEDAHRDSSKPYIISVDEFMAGDLNYSQVSLTYFVEDDTLVDDADNSVEDTDTLVGETNLDQFGYRSKDPKMIYVRNDITQTDFEISRDERSYGEVVHGVIPAKKTLPPRKMRRE